MKLTAINAENWKTDGGVVFGVVPKAIWSKLVPADENNLIEVASRCLLIDTGDRKVLVDAGMGNKRDKKYYSHKHLFGHDSLTGNLHKAGYHPEDITDVLFTHLHDDHVGGAGFYDEDGEVKELFPNAAYHCSVQQWEWAMHPNKREAAAYFSDNLLPLKNSGKLHFIEEAGKFLPGIELLKFDGHTEGQLIPLIDYKGRKLVFTGDFLASAAHIPLPYIPSVDIRPLITLEEKENFLNKAADEQYILLFEHDYHNECCTVKHTEKGVRLAETFALKSI